MTTATKEGKPSYAVLFVHGFLDAGAIWDDVIARLGDPRLQPVSVDLPGMGPLAADAGALSLDRYVEWVRAEMCQTGLPTILVGQSMGAQVAELVAVAHPDQVAGLILVTPVPLGGVNAPAEVVAPFRQLGGDPEGQRRVRTMLSPALTPSQLDLLGDFAAPVPPATVSRLVDIWNDGDPEGDRPSRFGGPVIILRGDADGFVTEDMAAGIAARFETVRVETVPGAGHWLHLEQPTRVVEAIDAVVARLVVGGDWQQAFSKRSADAFAEAFAEDVTLEAGVMYRPLRGRDNIKQVMEAASKIYEHLAFTSQVSDGDRQYLQWRALAFGGVEVLGVTVITRNDAGQIQNVAIHHRPLGAALKFSATIAERLAGIIDPSHFLAAADLPQPFRS